MTTTDPPTTPLPEEQATPPPEPPRPRRHRVIAVYLVMVACAAAFVASARFDGETRVRPGVLTLVCCGAKDNQAIRGAGEWWRLVSAGFLHGHLAHLLVNLYALFVLGRLVERLWGLARFCIIYVAAVVAGTLASLAWTAGVSVGASGGVFGLFGAIVVFATAYRHLIPPESRRSLWLHLAVVLGINVILGLKLPVIDNAAHAGGLAAGLVAALVFKPTPARGEPTLLGSLLVRGLAFAAVATTAGCLAEAVNYARSADWRLARSIPMETLHLESDQLSVLVPQGWAYDPPRDGASGAGPDESTENGGEARQSHTTHVFTGWGAAVIQLGTVPLKRDAGIAPYVRQMKVQLASEGIELLSEKLVRVGKEFGKEIVFRRAAARGYEWRGRRVVFPMPDGRLADVSLHCRARWYAALNTVFQQVVESIHTTRVVERPRLADATRPRKQKPRNMWDRFRTDPRDVEACLFLAGHYAKEGKPEIARQALHRGLDARPGHADYHEQLALLYADPKIACCDPEEAVRHALKAVELNEQVARYHAALACAYEAAGDLNKALEAARRAAELDPTDAYFESLVERLGKKSREN